MGEIIELYIPVGNRELMIDIEAAIAVEGRTVISIGLHRFSARCIYLGSRKDQDHLVFDCERITP